MNKIEKNFELYKNRNDSDYEIVVNGQVVPTSVFIADPSKKEDIEIQGKNMFLSSELVKDLSPDTVDSRDFWRNATKHFPLFSVCGGKPQIENVDEVNKLTFSFAHSLNAIYWVTTYLEHNPNAKLLEIGPGHGGFHQYVTSIIDDENYYAIDVNPLFQHPRLFQTTGCTIPNKVPKKLDVVYSINVFQHLSKKQRTNYYQRIHKRLSDSGVFIFGMFLRKPENEAWPVWNYSDKNGRYYVQFFGQFTEVDTEEELLTELSNIGFSVRDITPTEVKTHYRTFICMRK